MFFFFPSTRTGLKIMDYDAWDSLLHACPVRWRIDSICYSLEALYLRRVNRAWRRVFLHWVNIIKFADLVVYRLRSMKTWSREPMNRNVTPHCVRIGSKVHWNLGLSPCRASYSHWQFPPRRSSSFDIEGWLWWWGDFRWSPGLGRC